MLLSYKVPQTAGKIGEVPLCVDVNLFMHIKLDVRGIREKIRNLNF